MIVITGQSTTHKKKNKAKYKKNAVRLSGPDRNPLLEITTKKCSKLVVFPIITLNNYASVSSEPDVLIKTNWTPKQRIIANLYCLISPHIGPNSNHNTRRLTLNNCALTVFSYNERFYSGWKTTANTSTAPSPVKSHVFGPASWYGEFSHTLLPSAHVINQIIYLSRLVSCSVFYAVHPAKENYQCLRYTIAARRRNRWQLHRTPKRGLTS